MLAQIVSLLQPSQGFLIQFSALLTGMGFGSMFYGLWKSRWLEQKSMLANYRSRRRRHLTPQNLRQRGTTVCLVLLCIACCIGGLALFIYGFDTFPTFLEFVSLAFIFIIGMLAGTFPFIIGIPLLCMVLSLAITVRVELNKEGWIPVLREHSGPGRPALVAGELLVPFCYRLVFDAAYQVPLKTIHISKQKVNLPDLLKRLPGVLDLAAKDAVYGTDPLLLGEKL